MKPKHLSSETSMIHDCKRMIGERVRQAFQATIVVDDNRNEISDAKIRVLNAKEVKRSYQRLSRLAPPRPSSSSERLPHNVCFLHLMVERKGVGVKGGAVDFAGKEIGRNREVDWSEKKREGDYGGLVREEEEGEEWGRGRIPTPTVNSGKDHTPPSPPKPSLRSTIDWWNLDISVVVAMALHVDHKATIIDGKAIAQTIRSEIASEVSTLIEKYGKAPGLAVVICGA
ncbi:unnamed protein product [Lactuca virosa]|uniref:Uncharacterized protein n=1 Tax=Lactuca virosa TaxID=75947 RepID=A0AAU9LM79_9ASTR|nr:unnamed protein product [Lactuca virosa]